MITLCNMANKEDKNKKLTPWIAHFQMNVEIRQYWVTSHISTATFPWNPNATKHLSMRTARTLAAPKAAAAAPCFKVVTNERESFRWFAFKQINEIEILNWKRCTMQARARVFLFVYSLMILQNLLRNPLLCQCFKNELKSCHW